MKTTAVAAIIVAAFLSVICAESCFAQDETKKTSSATPVIKSVSGEISAVSKNSVSIIYDRDPQSGREYEMLIPLGAGVQFNRMKSISEAKIGDRISVEYEESIDTFGGTERTKSRAMAISFIKSAPPAPVDPEEEEYKAQKQAAKGK